jgi:hypothetical protein
LESREITSAMEKPPRDIAETASQNFKKDSIPLRMYLKGLKILEKASISLKNSSKIIEIFIKAHISKLYFSENVFIKPRYFYKTLLKASSSLQKPPLL